MKTLIICAAGSSERLKKLTKNKPKSLIKIGNKMIINLVLQCFDFDIIKKIYIITCFKNKLLKKNIDKKFMHKIEFINNKIYKKTGNMYSLSLVGSKTKSDVIFVNADNLIEKSVVKKFIEKKNKNLVLIDKNRSLFLDEDPVKVKMRNDILLKIDKKLDKNDTNSVAIGLYKLSNKIFKEYLIIARKIFNSGFANAGFVEPLKYIIEKKKMYFNLLPWKI